jgi:hypothetical protein
MAEGRKLEREKLGYLLREGQRVSVRRDEEKQKQKAKIMLSILGQATQGKKTSQTAGYKPTQKSQKGRQDSQTPGGKKENRCYQCGKPRHFKWVCPEGKEEEKIISLMTFEKE